VIEVAALFLMLGLTAFGGPAAHIALMHAEVVKRRNWLGEQEFLELVSATDLVPGPNSTEMAIHIALPGPSVPLHLSLLCSSVVDPSLASTHSRYSARINRGIEDDASSLRDPPVQPARGQP